MNGIKTILIICIAVLSATASMGQNIQSAPVDFTIKRIFNDTILLRMLIEFETAGGPNALSGRGALSLCGCYCDSIWDAWPSEVGGGGIPGTGTLHFISSDAGPQGGAPAGPQNAVLGIRNVEGGIERTTDFDVWMKYLPVDFD